MIVARYWQDSNSNPFAEVIEWWPSVVPSFGINITLPPEAVVLDGDTLTEDVTWVSISQPAFDQDPVANVDVYTYPLTAGASLIDKATYDSSVAAQTQAVQDARAQREVELQQAADDRAAALTKIGTASGLTQAEIDSLLGGT